MKKFIFILILDLSLFIGRGAAQCVTVGSDANLCQGSQLSNLGGAVLNGTTTVKWSDGGVGGSFLPDNFSLSASWTPPLSFTGPATLTLEATLGCTVTPTSASFTVTVIPTIGTPSTPTPSATTICQGSPNTTYTTIAANATSYNWAVTGTGNTITGTGTTGTVTWAPGFTGSATVSVTATGCGTSAPAFTTVIVNPAVGTPSTPTPSATTICQGSPNTTYTTIAANATSYNWTVTGTGNTITGTGTIGTVTWAPGFTGSATVSVTATGCGTSAPAFTTVIVNPAVGTPSTPTPSATTICQGSPNTTYTTIAANATSYNWTVTGTGNTITGTGTIGTVTWAPGFTGSATVSVTATGCGTSAPAFTTVIVTPTVGTPDIPIPSASTICRGSSNTVYTTFATNATSYNWSVTGGGNHISGTGTTGTVNWSNSFSGVATISVTASGCGTSTPVSTTVTVIPTVGTPSTPTPSSTTICQGSENTTYTTSAANATSYNWTVSGTGNTISGTSTTATVSWAPGFTGSATVSVTATGCGTSVPASTTVTVNPALTAGISGGTTPVCYNTSPGTFTASGTGGNGSYAYLWYKDGISTGVSTQVYNPGRLTTTSSFYCSVTSGACGTVSTSVRNIIVYPDLTAGISGGISPICSNTSPGTFTANGSGGTGSYTYLWYKDLLSTGVTSQTYSPGLLTTSSSFYCAITSGSCGTVSTSATTIIVTPQPTADINYSGLPWCNTTGTHTVTQSGTPGGIYSSSPLGLSLNPSSGVINTGTSTPGTYTVVYTIPASAGCGLTTATVSVTILPAPSAPVIGSVTQTTCSSATGNVVLNGLPATGIWVVTRTPGGVTTAGSGTTTTITGLPAGSYSFEVSNSAGCNSPSSTGIVINPQPPSPSAPVQNVDCSLGYGNGIVTVTNPVGAGLQYSLDGGVYQSSAIFNAVNNGGHIISVTNSAGCTTIGSIFTVTCGCINPPNVALSSNTGTTCSTTPLTLSGNTFGGSATNVTLTTNGAGIVSPASENISPFAFTYTPVPADAGKIVTITITTNNPVGGLCNPGVTTYALTVNAMPEAPIIGTITNLTCTLPSGSVALNGLPATGTWTLIRNPAGITSSGSGPGTTVSGLPAGSYSFTVISQEGCTSTPSASAVIAPQPLAPTSPVPGNIIQPTCAISSGSVVLNGLPSTGTWILTRSPGGVTISGTGASATVTPLPSGTYTFTVTNAAGCMSAPSGNVVINPQPPIPAAPSVGTITSPTCILSTGGVLLSNLPSSGTWTLIRYPGTVVNIGTGTTTTITGLSTGTYNFTVTTVNGCLSVASANVVIPVQPAIPAYPSVGIITQPTLSVPYGSVALSGLPSSGSWTVTRLPGAVTTTGTGGSVTITNLAGGVYTFVVTNSLGCTSIESAPVTISTPGIPVLLITDPPAVCAPVTVDITSPGITAGSTPGLTYTYWNDSKATISYATPKAATTGTYYIKGTTVSGYFNIKPVIVTIDQLPVANAGADQVLDYQFSTTLDGSLEANQTGVWSLITGTGELSIVTDPKTPVNGLSSGDNAFVWTIKNGVCPAVSDTVSIIVQNLVIPTLITPNMDGKNDFFVLKGLTSLGKTELRIFDRRGVQLYINTDYKNTWNGVDFNDKPLPDDTYFYVIKAKNHKPLSGYIVIRR